MAQRFWARGGADFPLIYVGDGFSRENVTLVYDGTQPRLERSAGGFTGNQCFRWPDGSEHFVPVYTVVKDTPAIRAGLGLSPQKEGA